MNVPPNVMLRAVQIVCCAKGNDVTLYLFHNPNMPDKFFVHDAPGGMGNYTRLGRYNWTAPIREVYLAAERGMTELGAGTAPGGSGSAGNSTGA